MKINIIAVGNLKEEFWRAASAEYVKRLSRYAKIEIKEIQENRPAARNIAAINTSIDKEGDAILSAVKGSVIALDSRGELLSSEQLAELIRAAKDAGKEISFVIGGSDGLSEKVLTVAERLVSFGKVTYPHQLMRVILSEQIYRAFTIINNMPYHK
jgi:23S rRNA (pseudouridine1915-N3)-methyltransferase